VLAIAKRFVGLVGRTVRREVDDLPRGDSIREVLLADGRCLPADEVVICAGAHSAMLARALGERIPLNTERGYHTRNMVPGISMKHSIIWPAKPLW
jgi:D-amino-acid dehydrogenase